MTDLKDVIWRIREKFPVDHAELLALADRIEALTAEVERLRYHLDTALEVLIIEGVCDGECGACKEAPAALGEKQ